MMPLPEGTFPAPNLEFPSTKCSDGRQLHDKSSSDELSRIFFVGKSTSQAKKVRVSDTPT